MRFTKKTFTYIHNKVCSKTFMSVLAITIASGLYGQTIGKSVISSAGNTIAAGNNAISFTVGETIVGTVASSTQVTQGFWAVVTQEEVLSLENAMPLESEITVFPNPVSNQLTILNPATPLYHIAIYDLIGREVLRSEQKNNVVEHKVDLSQLSSGAYLVHILSIEGISLKTIKIIKN